MKHEGLVLGVARPARQIRVVSATGTTQKSFVPDIAHLDLGVQTDAPTVQKAQQDNLATMNGVLAALKAASRTKTSRPAISTSTRTSTTQVGSRRNRPGGMSAIS